jgi:hypothetical protein
MSEQHHAFAERVAAHIAIIINGARTRGKSATGQNIEEEGVGSGSACIWNGRRLLLTAKHVLDDVKPRDLRFFLRQGGKIDWAVQPAQPSLALGVPLKVERIVTSRSEDLACVVLSPEPDNRLEFVRLPKSFGKVPPDGGGILLYGCPSDQNVPVAAVRHQSELRVAFAARPRGCWAVVKGTVPPHFPSSFDPHRHFLLHYDPKEEGAMPLGFSGAGVWYRRKGRGSIWLADPVLAGIQTSWHRPSNTMIAVRSQIVRRFLEVEFPKGK